MGIPGKPGLPNDANDGTGNETPNPRRRDLREILDEDIIKLQAIPTHLGRINQTLLTGILKWFALDDFNYEIRKLDLAPFFNLNNLIHSCPVLKSKTTTQSVN